MVECVAVVTLNILTIIVFAKTRSLVKRSMYLVINLAVADSFAGGISGVLNFVVIGVPCNYWKYSVTPYGTLDNIRLSIELLFPLASVWNLAAISLERAHATFHPFRHRFIKHSVFGFVVAVIWVTAGLVSAALVLILNFSGQKIYFFVWSSFGSVCLFVNFVSYMSIVLKIYCGAHPQRHGAVSRERRLTKTLLIVTLASLLMWLPFVITSFIFFTIEILSSIPIAILRNLDVACIVLYFANSLVNPILYTTRIPEFRRALPSVLFRRQQRQVGVFPLRAL